MGGLGSATALPPPGSTRCPCTHLGCSPSPTKPFVPPGVPALGVSVSGSSSALGIGPRCFSRPEDMAEPGSAMAWARLWLGEAGLECPHTWDIFLLGCFPVHHLLVVLLLQGQESSEGLQAGPGGLCRVPQVPSPRDRGQAPTLVSAASDLRVLFMISSRRCSHRGSHTRPWPPRPAPGARQDLLQGKTCHAPCLEMPPTLTFFLSSRSCSSRWKCFSRSRRCRSASSRALASASSFCVTAGQEWMRCDREKRDGAGTRAGL